MKTTEILAESNQTTSQADASGHVKDLDASDTNQKHSVQESKKKNERFSNWNSFYKTENPWKYVDSFRDKTRIEIILDYVKWSHSENALDIGCGEGSVTLAASSLVEKISAFDLSSNAVAYAKKNRGRANISYYQMDATDFRYSNEIYDLILCTEILYYLDDPEKSTLFSEIRKSLSSSGYFLLSSRVDCRDFKDLDLDKHLDLLAKDFKVITVIPVWTKKWSHKQVRRICKYLTLNKAYNAFVRSINPYDAFMCLFVCIPLSKQTEQS